MHVRLKIAAKREFFRIEKMNNVLNQKYPPNLYHIPPTAGFILLSLEPFITPIKHGKGAVPTEFTCFTWDNARFGKKFTYLFDLE